MSLSSAILFLSFLIPVTIHFKLKTYKWYYTLFYNIGGPIEFYWQEKEYPGLFNIWLEAVFTCGLLILNGLVLLYGINRYFQNDPEASAFITVSFVFGLSSLVLQFLYRGRKKEKKLVDMRWEKRQEHWFHKRLKASINWIIIIHIALIYLLDYIHIADNEIGL